MNFAVTGLGGKNVSNFHSFTPSSVFFYLSMDKYQKKGIYFFLNKMLQHVTWKQWGGPVGVKGSLQKLQKLSDLVVDGFCNIFYGSCLGAGRHGSVADRHGDFDDQLGSRIAGKRTNWEEEV